MKPYGYIYETTNLINGNKYIGQKKSNKFLGNSYLGSGMIFVKAVNKYGKENFNVELICFCDTKKDLDAAERFYISQANAVKSSNYYNIGIGGQGGELFKGHMHSEASRNLMSNKRKGKRTLPEDFHQTEYQKHCMRMMSKIDGNPMKGKKHTEETKLKMRLNHYDCRKENNSFYGKHHTEETKKRISETSKGRNAGKLWINNGVTRKLVYKDQLQQYLDNGYKLGKIFD